MTIFDKHRVKIPARFAAAVLLLVLALPFSAMLVFTTNELSAIQRDGADQYLKSGLRAVSATVDQSLKSLEFTHALLFQDETFLNAMKRLAPYDLREEYSDYLNTTAIKTRIGEAAVANDYIYSIHAYSFSARRVFSSKINWDPRFNHYPEERSEWLETHINNERERPWCLTEDLRDGRVLISGYREIWDYASMSPAGLLSVNVDSETIAHMLDGVMPEDAGYAFITDGTGVLGSGDAETLSLITRLVPGETAEGSFGFELDGEEMFASFVTSSYSGFTYVSATPANQIQTSVPVMMRLMALFLLLYALLAAAITFLFHKVLAMHENVQKLAHENYTAELRYIQNQLNEHFLYNTLDSIRWLARGGDNASVCDMVFALANFYRKSLSSGKEAIPVKDAAGMAESYLMIQKIRMRDALSYGVWCEPELENEPILKTLIQPLVENAVVHGFKGIGRPGRVTIRFSREGGTMRVSVEDDGAGFEPERLAEVRRQLELNDPLCEQSFALKTVQSQAGIFYGRDIPLHIDTKPGEGAAVWFNVPMRPYINMS